MALHDLALAALSFPDSAPERAVEAGVAPARRIGGDLTLPLLKTADQVRGFAAADSLEGQGGAAASDLPARLDRHGICAFVDRWPLVGRPAATGLENHVRVTGVDLLVTGPHAHARAREFVLGSVTRRVLEALPCPTLMSH